MKKIEKIEKIEIKNLCYKYENCLLYTSDAADEL